MTTQLEWVRRRYRYGTLTGELWLRSLHATTGTKLARILAACDGAWVTSREVTKRSGINGNSVRPLLHAATLKRLVLRKAVGVDLDQPAGRFRVLWLYRLPQS